MLITFAEWRQANQHVNVEYSSHIKVWSRAGEPNHTALWRLSDYVVSSVCGPFVVLVPR